MKPVKLKEAELTVAILLTVIVLALMLVRAFYADGLWRDECAAVQLARMPAFTDVIKNFQYEAFPLLFPTLIRTYTNLFGTSDTAFRIFGFAVGALLVAVLWFNARQFYGSLPLLSLALLGLNTSILVWGTSVRGYGLGMVLILLVFGLIGKALVQPSRLRLAAALLAALASVHCLLYNSILLAAIAGSAIVISLFRRKLKLAAVFIAISAACAVSVIPYLGPYSSGREWDVMLKFPVNLSWLWKQLNSAFGAPSEVLILVWHVLLAAIVGGTIWRFWETRREKPAPEWDWLLMCLLSMAVAVAGYFVFLKVLGYTTYEWYYLALMALLAAGIELLAENLVRIRWVRLARLGFVIVAMIALPFAAWPKITTQQTNMDRVAQMMEQITKPSDLIVVTPWFYGVSFNWYYRGATPWTTLPKISEHRTHRYDLLKEKMMSLNPIDDVRASVAKTLQAGGRIWMIGDFYPPQPGEIPAALPPAPTAEGGWSESAYDENWSLQMIWFVQQHAAKWGRVNFPVSGRVNRLEDVLILMAEGWQ